jgi:predicted ester cyclase
MEARDERYRFKDAQDLYRRAWGMNFHAVIILIYDVVKVLADKDKVAKRLEVYSTISGVGHDIYPYLGSHPTFTMHIVRNLRVRTRYRFSSHRKTSVVASNYASVVY